MSLRMGVIVALFVAAVGCSGTKAADGSKTAEQLSALVGTWTASFSVGSTAGQATVTFRADGSCESSTAIGSAVYQLGGTWTVSGDVVHYTTTSCKASQNGSAPAPCSFQYKDMQFKLNGDTLTLTELLADGAVATSNTYARVK